MRSSLGNVSGDGASISTVAVDVECQHEVAQQFIRDVHILIPQHNRKILFCNAARP